MKDIAPDNPFFVKGLIDEDLVPWLKKTSNSWLGRPQLVRHREKED